jgi:hypothetical protein
MTDPYPARCARRPPPFRGRGKKASEQRHQESERRRGGAGLRHDLMQAAAAKPAMGQMAVDGLNAERQRAGGAKTLHFRQ